MKNILIVLNLLIGYSSLCQPCKNGQACSNPNPSGVMNPAIVSARKASYLGKKNYLEQRFGFKDDELIAYDPCGFLDLLKELVDPASKYDGLRVYFGFDMATNKMTLIYVPTRPDGLIHRDDTSKCFVINGVNTNNIRSGTASKLILNYESQRLPYYNLYGKAISATGSFSDTKSLWYEITSMTPGDKPGGGIGLIDFLQCGINSGEINAVNAYFGGFELQDYRDQMTLIFNFQSPTKRILDKYFFLSHSFSKKRGKDTDTGVPCPPPPTPNGPCPGSLLPS